MKNYLKFSIKNKKLDKHTAIFDLPAGKTCPGANECHSFVTVKDGKRTVKDGVNCQFRCYAASQEALFSAVYEKRKYNLELIQNTLNSENGFYKTYELINESLHKSINKNIKKVRIHSSGDFFSGEYLRCWFAVAKLNTQLKFYCYSKSLNLFGTNVSIPDNFYLTASMGGKYDYLIHKGYFKRWAIVVNSEAEAIKKGIEHIGKPYKIDKDDSSCFENSPFALLIHGTQKKGYFKNIKK